MGFEVMKLGLRCKGWRCVLLAVLLLSHANGVIAGTTGTISGIVTDTDGTPSADAT